MGARDLLDSLAGAGVTVTAAGDRLVIRPASKLNDHQRAALRQAKPELLALLGGRPPSDVRPLPGFAGAWTGEDIARFTERCARLLRWRWPTADAEAMAERLTLRDRSGDERVSCAECGHYRPGRCGNHRRAGLNVADVGRDFAGLLQRCPGFEP